MAYPNKQNYFYMDCLEWIHLPQYPEESTDLWMNIIYEHYSIYRTIFVCKNRAHLKEIHYQLKQLEVPICILRSIWDLRFFNSSSYRILLITFDQYYYHADLLKTYLYQDYYFMVLQDLSSLQEQYCLQKLHIGLTEKELEKYYITIN